MKHYSLRTMIAARFAFIALSIVFLISVLSNVLINKQFEKYLVEQQRQEAQEISLQLSNQYDNSSNKWNLDYVHGLGMYALNEGYIIKLYDKDEDILWDAQNHDMTLCFHMMNSISSRMKENRPELQGDFVTHRFDLQQNDLIIGFLDVSYYTPYYLDENDFHFIDSLNQILVAVGVISLIGAIIMGLFFANNLTKPITKTVKMAEQISNGDYKIRFQENVKTKELFGLLHAVNQMAESLEKQDNLKIRLTSDIAHELFTPLANVSLYLEAIIEGVWEPTVDRLQSCYDELKRISKLVSDLDGLKQIENENLILHQTQVDLLKLIQTVVNNFEKQMTDKNIQCMIFGQPIFIFVDQDKIKQVLTNLISNAIKYSNKNSSIQIIIEESEKTVILKIKDEGIGIAKDELPMIFERFYRTDKSRSRQTGGAGIGLAITKAIVQAHDGKIEVESERGRGTTFTVFIPKKSDILS